MADDLEAFLRQAAQRRAQRQAPVARPAAPERPPATPPPQNPPPTQPPRKVRTIAAPAAPRSSEIVTAQVVPATEASRVGTRVNTKEFEQRAEQLGEEVGLADEHMEAHITQKFDHHVGSLDLDDGTGAGAGPADAGFDVAGLIAMLQDPKTLRHAVLLSEILNPPDLRS